METSLLLLDYRNMTDTLPVKHGINISEKVRKTLLEVDPGGVMLTRKKLIRRKMYYTDRSGHIFHIDSNSKLKR